MVRKTISVKIPEEVLSRLDQFADLMGLNRTAAMIFLITQGIDKSGLVARNIDDEDM